MFLKADNIKSAHAFSTRWGGVSKLSHTADFNLAYGRGDDNDTVIRNLELFGAEAGFEPRSVVSLPQIHSDIIYKVDGRDAGQGYYICEDIREGDGYITNSSDVTLGVKSADCVPILFEAFDGDKIIAVGAVHAGWRGSVKGIAPKCVRMLCEECGADAKNIRVAIGPCIHKCCFEVGEDFLCEFTDVLGNDIAMQFISRAQTPGKYFCDLVALNKYLLTNSGVIPENIEIVDRCTCCEPEMFFSHRYSRGLRGTMLSVIRM
ncbi:MAG: peptidoglycan editing factor PgeF [Ruminococcaceae bacterium]|nr:peptidoglycan editing factor PgeF [Oscillospiraceae bacterium]